MYPDIRRTQLLLESEGGWPGELEAPYRLHRKRSGLLGWFLTSGCLVPDSEGTKKAKKYPPRSLALPGFSPGSQGSGDPVTFPGDPVTFPGDPVTFTAEIPCHHWVVPKPWISTDP